MKSFYLAVIVVFSMILAACAAASENSGTPSPTEDPRLKPLKEYAAEKLNINQSEITLVRMTEQEWPDACLGLPEKEEMCAMVVTPGYLVIFNSPQGTLEFHTNQDISYFRLAPPGSKTTLMTWERSGGIAGICQNVIILSDNSYTLSECSGKILAEGRLIEEDATELGKYLDQFTTTDWFSKQAPGSADMFNDHLILYGKGQEKASENQMVTFNDWIGSLVGRLIQQNSPDISFESGIEGKVMIGPTCPGPARAGDTECADKPYVAWISILEKSGKEVARVQSDENGYYRISLPAGKYTLTPESPAIMPYAEKQVVEVTAGSYILVNINYDSGIR